VKGNEKHVERHLEDDDVGVRSLRRVGTARSEVGREAVIPAKESTGISEGRNRKEKRRERGGKGEGKEREGGGEGRRRTNPREEDATPAPLRASPAD